MPTSQPSPEESVADAPIVTVATVVLNAADDLAITLESIVGQDLPGVERLVLDGMSWDGTHDVLARYRDVVSRIETAEDAGIFPAMNEAARLARGEFILFMNAGDRFHRADSLRTLLARKPADVDIVFGDHVWLSGGVEEFRPARDPAVQVELLRAGRVDGRWLARFPAHQATLTRTSLLRRLRYDAALRVCADHDFLLRAAWAGAKVAYVDETVAVYADGGYSARNAARLRLEFNAVYRTFCERPECVDELLFGAASPFGGQRSPFTGAFVSGVSPPRIETAGLPVAGWHSLIGRGGARLTTPVHAGATGLRIAGVNAAEGQEVRIFHDSELVGRAALPVGPFAAAIPFTRPVAARSVVEISPTRGSVETDGIDAAFAFHELTFVIGGGGVHLARGERLSVRDGGDDIAAALAGGWWPPEAEHVWSAGPCALALRSNGAVSHVRLTIGGNPVLADQTLSLHLNGVSIACSPLGAAPTVVEAVVGSVWRDGTTNTVSLVPSASATVGADPRNLGVALLSVELQ